MVVLFVLIMAFLGYIYYKGQTEAIITPAVTPVVTPAAAVIVPSAPVTYSTVATPVTYKTVEAPVTYRTVETPATYRIVETSAPVTYNTVATLPEFSTSFIDTESLSAPLVPPQIYRQSSPVSLELTPNFSAQSYY
jgi:hypothetical protein